MKYESAPASRPEPNLIGRRLDHSAERFPEKKAILYHPNGPTVTYGELKSLSDTVARALLALDLKPGDHVALWANNIPEWIYVQFGCAKAGVILVTVNPNYRTLELEYLLKQSDCTTLFLVDGVRSKNEFVDMLNELCPELKNSKPGALHSPRLPALRNIVTLGMESCPGAFSWSDFLAGTEKVSRQDLVTRQDSLKSDDVIGMQYTSGTTGFPKGVMLTHANMIGNVIRVAEVMHFTQDDRLCIPVPFFHCFGSVLGTLLCAVKGATMVPLPKYLPEEVLNVAAACRCTALYGVPAMFIAELDVLRRKTFDVSSLRTGIIGGSPCPPELVREIMLRMNLRELSIAYGMTEASPLITMTRTDDPDEKRISTVGRSLPNTETRLTDPETGTPAGTGQLGEFCCRGYNVMKGYYKMPEATDRAIDREGWLHSGDLATVDAEGFYRITGRSKDMIIRGGENIYPREIEDFLFTHPAVKDVQVVGIPCPRLGERVVAFVQRKTPDGVEADELKAFCKKQIAYQKIPEFFFFDIPYPMTANGKVQKFKLRDKAVELLGLQAEARAAAKISAPSRFSPDTNGSQDVFNCIEIHVAPWGLSTDMLFQAAAALAEFLEASSGLLKDDRSFQVVFGFDHYRLTMDIEYRGDALDFPKEKPTRETFMKDPRGALALSGYLMQSYAAHIEAHEENGTQKVRCIFESPTEGVTPTSK